MKLGSQQHKELFCLSFIDTHLDYEPEKLPWPELDQIALERLRGIPFWTEALYTERAAGVMVSAFANTIEDSLLREAIALQGREESRHARLGNYGRGLWGLIKAFGGAGEREERAFPATGAKSFIDDLTPEMFLSACLAENAKRMSVFDRRLLQPRLMPRLSQIALNCLRLIPKLSVTNPNTMRGNI